MSARHDMIDWVGGFPFEVARPEEVFSCVRRLGFELRHLKTCGGGLGCNEYVFERIRVGPAARYGNQRTEAEVLAAPESTATRSRVWRLAAVPFAFGACFRVLVVLYVQVLHGNFLFLDDQGYDKIGWSLAQAWHMNTFPSPGSVEYAGTLSYLYYVFVAAVYFVLGHHWMLVKLLTALLSALSVLAAAAIGDSLAGRRLGVASAWLAAVYPSGVFWGATGLKDGPLATLLLLLAAIVLRPLTMRRLAVAAVLIVVAFLSRPVAGVIGLAMLVLPVIELGRGRRHGQEHRARTRLGHACPARRGSCPVGGVLLPGCPLSAGPEGRPGG